MAAEQMVLINVLDKKYYDDCRISGSTNVPSSGIADYAQDLDKEINIVVYCASYTCSASRQAWHTLNDMGFKNVWAYEGGANEWRHTGLPTEGSCTESYLAEPVTRSEKPEDKEVREIRIGELKVKMEKYGIK